VLDGAGGGAAHARGDADRAVLGQDHARDPDRGGRAQQGAEVLGVLQAVEHEVERRVGRARGVEQLGEVGVGVGVDLGRHALMVVGEAVEVGALDVLHGHAALGG
jgi:hypothetical protein